ncbi:hypothetical protein LCGC14_1352470 [marine sediment metagenome]|uniref:Uncharacterized protein n=1 Tax=marine sediment metagenome TaxID=412755 RepID=A0A0F9MR29_9ZZZZ
MIQMYISMHGCSIHNESDYSGVDQELLELNEECELHGFGTGVESLVVVACELARMRGQRLAIHVDCESTSYEPAHSLYDEFLPRLRRDLEHYRSNSKIYGLEAEPMRRLIAIVERLAAE